MPLNEELSSEEVPHDSYVSEIEHADIQTALGIAGIEGFNGEYESLGGGEVNNTYRLQLENQTAILRIAKDEGQRTLENEARALNLLSSPHVPKLIFFDETILIKERLWILESDIPGTTEKRLTVEQFHSLGNLLAQVHTVTSDLEHVDLRQQFLYACRAFGDEQLFLDHPDTQLRQLIHWLYSEFEKQQPLFNAVTPTLIHQDVTPSNILANGNDVGLIDWEFSKFNDPMVDFSTIYYEDMEYNQGKWRIQITPEEKATLFNGYEAGGGKIDEARIKFWIDFDKVGAAIFLYWRLHESKRPTPEDQQAQYRLDYQNILSSLATRIG